MAKLPFTVYERPNSAFWWIRYPDGKRESLKLRRDECGREEAQRAACAKVAERATIIPAVIAEQVSMTDAVEQYVKHLEQTDPGSDPRRVGSRISALARLETRWPTPRLITEASWEQAKHELHAGRPPLKWRSIALIGTALRGFVAWAHARGYIAEVPRLPSPPMKWQASERESRRAFTIEERDRFLVEMAVLDARAHRIYVVLFATWMRKGAVETMTLRWVNFHAETIHIPAKHNKTRRDALIDMPPEAASALRAELACQHVTDPDAPIFGRFDFGDHDGRGHGIGLFHQACDRAGIDMHGVTPTHIGRHTGATIAGQRPTATVAGMMAQGAWLSASIPERTYLHPTLEDARRATRGR